MEFKMNKNKIKIVAKPYQPTEKEKELHKWVLPIFEKYWGELTKDKDFLIKPKLYVAHFFFGACHNILKVKTGKTQKEYHSINLPAENVELAKLGKSKELELYSGKKIKVSVMSMLVTSVVHEICHCIYDIKKSGLNEGIAEWISFDKVIKDVTNGEPLVAYFISARLIEANLLKYAYIQNIKDINIPLKLSDSSLNLIQNELDDYFLNPDKAKLVYRAAKTTMSSVYNEYENYVKGFIKFLHLYTLNSLFVKLYSIKKSPPHK